MVPFQEMCISSGVGINHSPYHDLYESTIYSLIGSGAFEVLNKSDQSLVFTATKGSVAVIYRYDT